VIQIVPDEVAREAIAFNAQLEAALADLPPLHTVPPALVRAGRRAGKGIFRPSVFLDEATWVDAAGVTLRVVRPPGEPRGVYLHMHGGGWMLGAADLQDADLRALAHATGLVAASIEYRLAPEHPFPAAIHDCERAARWVVDGGLNTPAWFAIGGESAGAHLAALVLQRVRGFAKANLVYGAYDLGLTPSVRRWGDRNLVLSRPIVEYFVSSFAPGRSHEDCRAPELSPLYADLAHMPPALFTVGTLDPLVDDSLFMYERWRAAGNAAELHVWPHAVHGFNGFTLAVGRLADADQHAWLAA